MFVLGEDVVHELVVLVPPLSKLVVDLSVERGPRPRRIGGSADPTGCGR